jgi:hypothetical protein
MSSNDPDELLPIQDAAKEFSVSVASLHKYAALGRIRKYRRGFDRITYVNRGELADLANLATATWFVVDVPLDEQSDTLRELLARLQDTFPSRSWERAGWGSFALVNGTRSHPYTALKYKAHHQRAIFSELVEVLDQIDPDGKVVDRYKISLHDYPFETDRSIR